MVRENNSDSRDEGFSERKKVVGSSHGAFSPTVRLRASGGVPTFQSHHFIPLSNSRDYGFRRQRKEIWRMLETNLKHIETTEQFKELIGNNEKAIICCGRMGPMCIPVYQILEVLQEKYPDIRMRDMDFDVPVAAAIKNLPECRGFTALPFTVYFRGGKVVKATASIQTARELKSVINEVLA